MNDPIFRMLAALPSGNPDAAHADRVRARCRRALTRRRRQYRRGFVPRVWPPLGVALGGIYLFEVVREALQMYAMR
jgi:hypothetical protein